jgi:hypothetical protein
VQLERDDSEGKDSIDAESDSESEGDEDINLDAPLPPRAITFKIDADIDITSHALRDMVAVDHSVKQSAAPQTSTRSRSIQEKTSAQPDWDW